MKKVVSANTAGHLSIIFAEILGKILYFPVWWYTIGFFKRIKKSIKNIKDKEKSLGLSVWLKNIFVPMYGQTDFSGRIISFFIRLFQIIFRSFILFFWIVVGLITVILWLAIPVMIVLALIFQIF